MFLLSSSLTFVQSSSLRSLALEMDSNRHLNSLEWDNNMSSSIYLCVSKASDFCSSWIFAWLCSSFSACCSWTLLSSSSLASLFCIITAFSSLLCSKSTAITLQFFYIKDEDFNSSKRNIKYFFIRHLTWVSSQHCFALCSSWRREFCSTFDRLRSSFCSSIG